MMHIFLKVFCKKQNNKKNSSGYVDASDELQDHVTRSLYLGRTFINNASFDPI